MTGLYPTSNSIPLIETMSCKAIKPIGTSVLDPYDSLVFDLEFIIHTFQWQEIRLLTLFMAPVQ
jgi:hypothetical protein